MKYIYNIKESLARILIFVMVFMQVVGNGSIIPVFAEAFTREHEDGNIASASNAIQNGKVSLRNLEQKDLELMIQSESSRYESGDMLYLDVYLKNNSSNEITDGVLKFSGKGLVKEDGYFEDYQGSYSDMGPGSSHEDLDEEETEEDEGETEEVGTISEDGKLSNIVLKPNSVYHVGFYCTVDDIEDMKSSDVSFTFKGKQDKKRVSTSEKFEYTIGGMNLLPVELDEELEVGGEYTMTLDFDLGSKFEEIIDDKMLEDEVEKEEESETSDEKETEVEKASDSEAKPVEESKETEESESEKVETEAETEKGSEEEAAVEAEGKEIETEKEIESEEDKPELSLEKVDRDIVKSSLTEETESEESKETEESEESKETNEVETDESIENNGDNEDEKVGNSNIEESIEETEGIKETESEEIKETESKIEDETNSDNTNNIDKDDDKLDLASPSNATSKDKDKETSSVDKDKDKDKIATPSNAYVKWDTDDINKDEKPVIKDIKCEVDTYGIELEDFEVVDGDSELNTKLHVKFKVKDDQEPGIYFGKVEATYKYKNKTYKTNQGFMLNVLGEVIDWDEEITLVGYLGDTEVTVSGPRRSFPVADELELSVSEVETEKQELVDSTLNEKQEELGLGVSGVKALDIKVLADGEYQELNGDVKVNFKNLSLQGVYKNLEFSEEELAEIAEVNDLGSDVQLLSLEDDAEETKEAIEEAKTEITEDTMVYHLDEEEEKLTEMVSSLNEDGDIEMETDHFSIYIIVNFETTGIEVNVSHWANVIDFTLENGGLEDIASKEFRNTHMNEFEINRTPFRNYINPDETNNTLNELKIRLSELKYSSSFNKNMIVYGFIVKNNTRKNGIEFDATKYEKVPDKLYPGMIEKDDGTLGYPTSHKEIYSGNTYVLPGWATKGIPYTILLDKLSKINNVDEKNYSIDTITFITADSETDNINRKEIVFKNNGDSYEVISGELPNNPSIDNLDNLNGINRDDTLLELNKYNEVKFEYIETTGESEVDTAFHDYNLGEIYKDNKKSSSNYKPFNGINAARVYRKDENGIEIDTINYGGTKDRVYVGGGSLNLGFSPFDTDEYNGKIYKPTDKINKNFNNPVLGSVKKRINKGDYNIFNYKDPGLFYPENLYSIYTNSDNVETEMIAKEYITGYKIGFKRSGDTYVIQNVKNDSGDILDGLDELDVLKYTGPKYYLNYPLYSNMFWPLDSLGNRENGCQDELKPLLKDDIYDKNNTHNFSENDEDKSGNKEVRHNWLFGMNFDLTFNVKEYTGPLNYYFRGDDDLFVYIDGHLMVDLGGIHSSWGKFVDVRQFLLDEGLAKRRNENDPDSDLIPLVNGEEVEDHEYTMSVFYTERGGTGSCCYMMYTLPKVKPVEVPIYDTLQHTISKTWNDGGNTANRPSEIGIQIYQNGKAYGEQMTLRNSDINGDNQTWRYVWNNLPAFDENGEKYVYEVREINVDTDKYIQTENKHNTNNTNLINTLKSDSISVSKAWSDSTPMNQRTPIKVGLYKYSYKIGISDSEADAGEGEESEDPELGEGSEESEENKDEPSGSTDETDEPSSGNPDDSQETESVVENELTRLDLTPEMIDKLELVSFEGLDCCQDVKPIIELSSTNSSYSWDNLPAYENDGRKILYVPFEVEVDDKGIVNRIDEGHTTSDEKFVVNYDGNNHITNNYNLMALAANKTWAVQNELDKDIENTIRPEIGVQLYQNGYTYGKSVTLNEANNWTCKFTDVPRVSEDGTEYNYTVKEAYQGRPVTGDTITVDNKYQYQVTYTESDNLFTVNNTLKEVKRANFTVKKEWKGEEGAINKETSVDIGLFRDGELYEKVTLSEENGWQHSWNNMELNKDLDTQYSYSIYELNGDTKLEDGTDIRFNGIDKYKVQYKTENRLTVITNTFQEIPKISLLVQKGWNDGEQKRHNDMSYGPELNCRPSFIKIQLYQDGAAFGEPVRMTGDRYIEEEPWTYRFKDLPKYHVVNGEEVDYVYTVKELNTNGEPMDNKDTCRFNGSDKYIVRYGTSGLLGQETATNKIITNSRVPDPVKNLVIEKQWLNNDNPEGSEVTEIGVRIYRTNADGVRTVYRNAVILTKANGWKTTISNVPAEDKQDRPYTYSIVELSKPAVAGDELAKGATFRFNGVDKYVVDYTSDGNNLKVSNTYVNPPLTKVKVTKTWAGEGESIDKRPSEVYVKLYRTVDGVLKEQVGNIITITPDANGVYSYTWNDLKAHNLNDEAYTFSVVECLTNGNDIENGTTVRLEGKDRDKYTVTYSDGSYNDTENMWSFGITNTYVEPIREEFIVRKKWTGATTHPNVEIEAGIYRSDTNLAGMKLYKTVKLNASNNWEARVMVENYNNYDVGYVYEVKEFLNGQPLRHNSTIKLENKKYYVQYEIEPSDGAWVIKNNYIAPENIDVSVEKNWDFRNYNWEIDEYPNIGDEVKVRLYQALEGSDDYKVLENEISLNNYNDWKWSSSLPKYIEDANETQYKYKFVELDKNGNELDAGAFTRFNGVDKWQVSYETSGANDETWGVTNTYIAPERINVSVEKHWNDGEETYRRPDKLKVQLYVQEKDHEGNLSEPKKYTPNGVVELTPDKEWKYTWENLLKKTNDDREFEYVYTVKEMSVNTVLDEDDIMWINGTHKYQVHYESAGYQNDIYNTFIAPEKTDVKVTKVWDGDDERLKDRPESIEVQLYRTEAGSNRHETYGGKVTLNEANGWTYTWNDLFVKTHDIREIKYNYSVKEWYNGVELNEGTQLRFNGVDKYEVNYSKNSDYDLTITNKFIAPSKINVRVTKNWVGDTSANRPNSIYVRLYRSVENGTKELVDTQELSGGATSYEWVDLDEYNLEDKEYTYSVVECVLNSDDTYRDLTDGETLRLEGPYRDKYTVSYPESEDDKNFSIVNTFVAPEMVDISVLKTWSGENSNIPTSIDVGLFRDDSIVDRVTLNAENHWIHNWNVEKTDYYDNEYTYNVYELDGNGNKLEDGDIIKIDGRKYKVDYSSSIGNTHVVNNEYQKPAEALVKVSKKWKDTGATEQEHNEIIVRLYRDNEVLEDNISLNKDNGWTWEKMLAKHQEDEDDTPYIFRFVELDKNGKEMNEGDTCRFNGVDKFSAEYVYSGDNNENWEITNNFVEPPRKDIVVKKIWANDVETQRPAEIKVQLYINEKGSTDIKKYGDEVSLTKDKDWTYTWKDLLEKTNDDREIEYEYTVKELFNGRELEDTDRVRFNGVDKYEVSYNVIGDRTEITNTFIEPDRTQVSVTKIWADDKVEYRPSEVQVQLYEYENGYAEPKAYGDVVALNASNNWTHTWNNLLVKTNDDRETLYTYSVKEVFNGAELEEGTKIRFNGVDKYEVSYGSNSDYDLTITNRWIEPPVRRLKVVKTWVNSTEDAKPDSLNMHLYQIDADKNQILYKDDIVLSKENGWRVEFDVPAQDLQDRDYDYRIAEVVNGKELAENEQVRFNGFDKFKVNYLRGIIDTWELITQNTFIPRATVDVSVVKEWVDNSEDTRPESVTVELLRDGKRFTQEGINTRVELNADNNWSTTWNGLYEAEISPDLNDIDYKYSIVEMYNDRDLEVDDVVRLDGYNKYKVYYSSDVSGKNWTVRNSFVDPTMKKIVVDKVWDGGNDTTRSESISVRLYRDEEAIETIELNESNNWHHEWSVEAERTDDTLYNYRVAEVLDGVDLKDDDIVKFNGRSKYKVSYKVTKTEVVEETERQDGKLTNDTYVITNIYQTPPTKSISVEKIWDEKDRELGEGEVVKHEDITVNLYRNEVLYDTVVLNESNGYKHDWTEAIHAEDENDTPYIYRIAEVFNGKDLSAGDKVRFNGVDKYEVGYESEVDTEKGKYTITNKYLKPIMKDISIEKKWDKDDESKRPSEIIVNLYQDNNLLETISLNKDNGWKVTRNVMVERNDDSLYEYHVKEVFKGKELESGDRVKFNGVDKYEVAYTSNDVTSDNFVITNSFIEPNRRDINVQKVWEDNTASTRPDSIKVRLYQDDEIFDTVDLNSKNSWKYEWEGLFVNRNDENETEFDYSIKEVFVKDGKEIELEDRDIVRLNGIDKYETHYSKRDADHFVITNKFVEPTMKDVSVEKVWIDNGSSTRPDGIEVGLYQDNRLINRVTLNESNNWKHTWSVQVERNDDSLYEYEIAEMFNGKRLEKGSLIRFNGIDKYLVDYEDISEDSYRITNRFIEPDMTSVRVEKVWVDTAKIARPTEITVRLYQDNLVYDTVVLNEGNNWNTTWIVPVNRLDDSEYVYSVREVYDDKDLTEGDKVTFGTKNEYVVSYSSISENNFRITNTQEVTNTPPGGGGGSKEPEPPKEPELPKEVVPETPRPENPVPNIQRSIKDPLIRIYDIMDNMIPMTQTPTEINDNETPLYGLPGTGDKTNLGKYILLCLISTFGLLGLAFKNKKEENED